jgi:hypothetical protein
MRLLACGGGGDGLSHPPPHRRHREATLLPGAWRVVYQHAHRPKVSIIILAKDALDRLDRCLRKLLAKTAYPDYEVVVVDCGSEAEDTFDLYAELAECYPDRFRYTVASGPLSVAALPQPGGAGGTR